MMVFVRIIGALCLCIMAGGAAADGWSLREGRFPGKTTVIRLSDAQAARLDYLHACHRHNTRTPYLFHLTAEQSRLLEKEAGISATRFVVFDSTHGTTGVDITVNALVRFARLEAEIPHEGLVTDREAREYEQEIIGWEPNPLERASSDDVARGNCPD